MKYLILVILVATFFTTNSFAERVDLPPCRSFDFCYRVVLDSAGWKPSDKETEFVGRCEEIGDVCTVVGDDFWARCEVKCTMLRPDIPLYYWTLYREDKEEREDLLK